jgi:repressor LexA
MTTFEAAEAMTETVYRFVQTYLAEHGYPPSLREIGAFVHLAPSGVARYLDRLEARGRLTRQVGQARGITLKGEKSKQMSEQMFHTF